MNQLFGYKTLNEEGVGKSNEISIAFDELLTKLELLCGYTDIAGLRVMANGREFSIVKTKLEEASMYAKKSMSLALSNQK